MTAKQEAERLGIIYLPNRWSGDTHSDKDTGCVDVDATEALIESQAAEIERLQRREQQVKSYCMPTETELTDAECMRGYIGECFADAKEAATELEALRDEAARYRWLAKEHGWLLLKHFPAVRPYVDASEVIDESIDAAMKGETP